MPQSNSFRSALENLRSLTPEERKKVFAQIRSERDKEIAEEMVEYNRELEELPNSHFSKAHLLRRLPNPGQLSYEQKILIPEFTFVGVLNQPDFGEILLTFYPQKWTIELKSLKVYKDAFRGIPISYERVSNVIFEDLITVFEPTRLRFLMRLRPRGGISSCLTIDSDWAIRGGKEQFRDWTNNTDHFGFETRGASRIS